MQLPIFKQHVLQRSGVIIEPGGVPHGGANPLLIPLFPAGQIV